MLRRNLEPSVQLALSEAPVVMIAGARQVGKSTLVQKVMQGRAVENSYTFDDDLVASVAREDPVNFIHGLRLPVAIDEVQRVPEIVLPIKTVVDRKRHAGEPANGMFLLTGSVDLWKSLRTPESLAGRIARLVLQPFSQGELRQVKETFLQNLFEAITPQVTAEAVGRVAVADLVVQGGYPELFEKGQAARQRWFNQYLSTIVDRDIADLSAHSISLNLAQILALVGTRTGTPFNVESAANDLQVARVTLRRHINLLLSTHLLWELPAFSTNLGQRLIKAPKIYLLDSGLMANMLGFDKRRFMGENLAFPNPGVLFENFVANELRKQISWSDQLINFSYYRNTNGVEINFVFERNDGATVAIEAKLSAAIGKRDLHGLRLLRDRLGERFRAGVILYTGEKTVPLGDRLWAIPACGLWA